MAGKGLRSPWLLLLLGVTVGVGVMLLLNRKQWPLPVAANVAGKLPSDQLSPTQNAAPKLKLLSDRKTESNSLIVSKTALSLPTVLSPYHVVHVLCIGISHYGSPWPDLAYGEKDAKDITSALSETFGSNIKIHGPLLGLQATKKNILAAMDSIESNPEDDVIIFYSGHGATVEVTNAAVGSTERHARFGFLVPYDSEHGLMTSLSDYTNKALDMRLFVDRFQRIPARHLICLIDSCFSASGISFVNPRNKVPNDRVKDLLGKPTVQIITTGAELEKAPAKPAGAENSLLTYALIQVLKSGGIQTGDEVYFRIRQMVREMAHDNSFLLNPQRRYLKESSGDFVFIPPSKREQWADEIAVADPNDVKGYYLAVSESEVSDARAAAETGGKEDDARWKSQIDRLETRASMGDANAAAVLVHLYGQGVGTRADANRAYIWACEGYDTQTPAGRYALGVAFFNGYGVPRNETESKALWGLAGVQMLSRYGMSAKFIQGLNLTGLLGTKGGRGPNNPIDAANEVITIYNFFRNKPENPLVAMDERRKRVQERVVHLNWTGAEKEIVEWQKEVESLTAKLTDNPAAQQLKPQLQELQDFLLTELREMRGYAHDSLKNATSNSLYRVQQKLITIQTDNQPKSKKP